MLAGRACAAISPGNAEPAKGIGGPTTLTGQCDKSYLSALADDGGRASVVS
jgi:hypothetical protein